MRITAADLRAALDRAFPIVEPSFEITFTTTEVVEHEGGDLLAEAAFARREADGDELVARSEGLVVLVRGVDRDAGDRLDAYLQGFARAIRRVQPAHLEETTFVEEIAFPELLGDPALATAEAVEAALLSPERLGSMGTAAWTKRLRRMAIAEMGLAEHADALLAYLAPSVRFDTLPEDDFDEEDVYPGTSRIGGMPDVPPGFEWPRFGGVPMAFVAQLDLAEMRTKIASPLPESGTLYFFFDADQADGSELANRGAWKVFHDASDLEQLTRAEPPGDLPRNARFPMLVVTYLKQEETAPPLESPHYEVLAGRLDAESIQPFASFVDCFGANADAREGIHRLLGYPELVQGDMFTYSEHVTRGIGWDDDGDARRLEIARDACAWQLLLQVDSVDDMMWGDGGRLYFLIKRDDLAARRFDEVWAIVQGH